MANWVTLNNGVHIDLDDPNNPITGTGTYESYFGGGKQSNIKDAIFKNAYYETMKNQKPAEILKEIRSNQYTLDVEGHYMSVSERKSYKNHIDALQKIYEQKMGKSKSSITEAKPGTKTYAMNQLKSALDKYTLDEDDCQNMISAISSNVSMKKQVLDAIDKEVEDAKEWANKEFKNTRAGNKDKQSYLATVESDAEYKRNTIKYEDWSVLDGADSAVADDLITTIRKTFNLKRPKK